MIHRHLDLHVTISFFGISFQIIHEDGAKIIPEIQYDEIIRNNGKIPNNIESEVAKRGILIVRSVLSQTEATNYLTELTDYMKINGEDPEKIGKTFYECYWSKAQVQILF